MTTKRRRSVRPACANCGARLSGPWCHMCGQHAEGLDRSFRQVMLEWLRGLVHFDQRARATLPDLVFHPARLTIDYLEGRRAPQVPPLRMFLVVLVLVFFAGGVADVARANRHAKPMFSFAASPAEADRNAAVPFDRLSPAQKATARSRISGLELEVAGRVARGPTAWLQGRLNRALDDPARYVKAFSAWARRLAFALLPIGCGLLCLIFARRKEVMVFDHLVFAMHSLSFQGLLLALTELVAIIPRVPALAIMLLAPAHLFVHMRGVYRTSVAGTVARISLLAGGAALAFVLLLGVAIVAGLAEIGAPS